MSWRRYTPALGLAFAFALFVSALLVHSREEAIGGAPSLAGTETNSAIDVRPVVTQKEARPPVARPAGLLELTIGAPERILLEPQRRDLIAHLKNVKVSMSVPDAMSFASKHVGPLWILSAASGRDTGFFLFSEKNSRRLTATGARKFLRDYFKDAITLQTIEADEKFLSRGLGEMAWIRGTSASSQKFDAYAIVAKKTGFNHLLFIYDPAVANASRRQMIDSMRVR